MYPSHVTVWLWHMEVEIRHTNHIHTHTMTTSEPLKLCCPNFLHTIPVLCIMHKHTPKVCYFLKVLLHTWKGMDKNKQQQKPLPPPSPSTTSSCQNTHVNFDFRTEALDGHGCSSNEAPSPHWNDAGIKIRDLGMYLKAHRALAGQNVWVVIPEGTHSSGKMTGLF